MIFLYTCSYYIYYINLTLLFALIRHLIKEHVFHCRMLNDVFDCDDDVCTLRKQGEIQVNIRLRKTSYRTLISAIILISICFSINLYFETDRFCYSITISMTECWYLFLQVYFGFNLLYNTSHVQPGLYSARVPAFNEPSHGHIVVIMRNKHGLIVTDSYSIRYWIFNWI